jgi:fumarylacetoacetase
VSSGFGVEHLPYGVGRPADGEPRCLVRLEDRALDLAVLDLPVPPGTFEAPALNAFLALGAPAWDAVRARLSELIGEGAELPGFALVNVELLLPVAVGDYVDFYSSLHHAQNVNRLFRPDDPDVLPNWRRLPVGYHGRSGTIVVSGTGVRRPLGQIGEGAFGPEPALDVELELAFVTGAQDIFGYVLLNDWSARAIQAFEYQPLGPFLGKSFATSIAAWITPAAALARHRADGPAQEPEPEPYLRVPEPRVLDLPLELERNGEAISHTNARHLYWGPEQQLAHARVNGATIRPGDLFGSGTISGPDPGSEGCLLEITRGGTEGTFLADGDEVVLRGGTADGLVTLAEVRGTILPAR